MNEELYCVQKIKDSMSLKKKSVFTKLIYTFDAHQNNCERIFCVVSG